MRTDLARFNRAGFGTLRFAVTDDEADTLVAKVIGADGDGLLVQVHWDQVLHRA